MADYYLAIDLGASGGRHILGHEEGGKLMLEEVYRFSNAAIKTGGSLVWDYDRLFDEITAGIEICAEKINKTGSRLNSAAIDTWGVDYVLIDAEGKPIEPVYAYRDSRTGPFLETAVAYEELYRITGIAKQPFNTIYQLLADKAAGRLEKADKLLFLSEYFSQRLTGNFHDRGCTEYTIASTSGLVDAAGKVWSKEILEKLELPARLFKPLRQPPYEIGSFSRELREKTGLDAKVIMTAGHDTASAVAVVRESSLYISSGTWSLLGVTGTAILNDEAKIAGYTNEGAHDGQIRFLKNIMGLWVMQSLSRELGENYNFAVLESLAASTEEFAPPDWTIDLNLPRFLAPESMIAEIKDEYKRTGKKIPESAGELAFSVYSSLAKCYKTAIDDLEKITGKTYPAISVIGGGSKDSYLNKLTARYTGKTVYSGPAEATAIGNLILQMRAAGDAAVKDGFINLLERSFDIREFTA